MTSRDKPSLDVIIERLQQNTALTKDVQKSVSEGFQGINSRLTKAERAIDRLKWQSENDKEEIEKAKEEAKEVIAFAATKAQQSVDDKPALGSTKWLIGFLAAIILALIAALR